MNDEEENYDAMRGILVAIAITAVVYGVWRVVSWVTK
jgi:hypothetical protein